jgi:hypothetical protein
MKLGILLSMLSISAIGIQKKPLYKERKKLWNSASKGVSKNPRNTKRKTQLKISAVKQESNKI